MKKRVTILLLSCGSMLSFGQQQVGPRIAAMGNNTAAVYDIWSISGNSAAITSLKSTTAAIGYTKYSFDTELSNQAIALVIPIDNNFVGLDFQRYGISIYNEITAGIAIAKKFGDLLSISIKGNYHQFRISGYGTTTGYTINVGACYQFNEKLNFGAYANNLARQNYKNQSTQTSIPSGINIGASYQASNKVLIATTLNKSLHRKLNVRIGLDYQLIEMLSIRSGLSIAPFKPTIGMGLAYKKFRFDVALENTAQFGYTPQIALAYAF